MSHHQRTLGAPRVCVFPQIEMSVLSTIGVITCDYLDSIKGLSPPTASVAMVTAPGKVF